MAASYSRMFPTLQAGFVGNIPLSICGDKSDKSAMAINELRQRVVRRLTEIGKGPVEAATSVEGLERNYIRDFVDAKKESMNEKYLELVARALQWTVAELRGEKPPERPDKLTGKLSTVPHLDKVSAGKLKNPSSQIPVEDVPLLAFADLGRGDFFALTVEGDSMDRVSPDGSTIVVNRLDRTLVNGKPYIFSNRGETTYKIWRAEPPRFAPYSTNPAHEPIYVKSKKDAEAMVVGRVKRSVLDL